MPPGSPLLSWRRQHPGSLDEASLPSEVTRTPLTPEATGARAKAQEDPSPGTPCPATGLMAQDHRGPKAPSPQGLGKNLRSMEAPREHVPATAGFLTR